MTPPGIDPGTVQLVEKHFLDVFSTVHHSSGLFLQPTLMHNSITTCTSHYYPRHVSGFDMPILRRNNCTNTAYGILALISSCNVLLLDVIKCFGGSMRVTSTNTVTQIPTRHSVYSCLLLRGLKKLFREISKKTALFVIMKYL